jgi:Glycosyl transferase family 2
MLSIIIPTLNEAAIIEATLGAVAKLRGQVEVLVVDGGSRPFMPWSIRSGARPTARMAPATACCSFSANGCFCRVGLREGAGEVVY